MSIETRTKEEIIKRYEPFPNKAHVNIIGKMMDEYAKQQSIAFNEWSMFNEPKYEKGHKWTCAGTTFDHPPKTSELYELFYKLNCNE